MPFPGAAFVLTHRPGPDLPMPSGVLHFLDTGVADALTRATTAAGDRDMAVMGADTARQALAAGLVDELRLQFVPVLLDGIIADLRQLGHRLGARRARPLPDHAVSARARVSSSDHVISGLPGSSAARARACPTSARP